MDLIQISFSELVLRAHCESFAHRYQSGLSPDKYPFCSYTLHTRDAQTNKRAREPKHAGVQFAEY